MRIGITGSRKRGNAEDRRLIREVLDMYDGEITAIHHGDCVGVDTSAHGVAKSRGIRTVAHPPSNPKLRAYCQADVIHEPKPYRQRNQDIVNAADVIIALPPGRADKHPRSGTWMTVRMAEKATKPIHFLWRS